MHRRTRNRRGGYVLVMTLVIIGIAGLALARLASRGLSLTLEARHGEIELQQRWAKLSCQTQLLEDPEQLFGDLAASFEQQALGWPHPAVVSGRCELGGVKLDIHLSDEQAKTNLNLLEGRRRELVVGILSEAAHEARMATPIQLRPSRTDADRRGQRFYQNWGQVIDLPNLRSSKALVDLAGNLTCWGEPRLNVTRASDASLETVARLELVGPEVQRLLEAREGFDGQLKDLLELAEIPRRKRFKLARLLTDRSSTYALWLQTSWEGKQRLTVTVTGDTRRDHQSYHWP